MLPANFLGLFQAYLPYIVGCAVAATVLTILASRSRARRGLQIPPADAVDRTSWEDHDQSFADRRGSVRREGKPVRIVLSSPVFRNKVETGWVLDRSRGGLRLAMATAVAPGSAVQVRAENAPDTIPWVTIFVRSCRNNGDYFELGCEFEQVPPWNVLLLFG